MNSSLLQATSVERNKQKWQKCSPVRRIEMGREWTSWLHSSSLFLSWTRGEWQQTSTFAPIQTQHSAWDTMEPQHPAMKLHFSENQKVQTQKEHEFDPKKLMRYRRHDYNKCSSSAPLLAYESYSHGRSSETSFLFDIILKSSAKTAPLHFHRASEMKISPFRPSMTTGNTCFP